ncbi:MAG TPA: hypothetical protein VFZ78_03095 [Flavisolibacter sp.]
MNRFLIIFLALATGTGCKNDDKRSSEEKGVYFPVQSFIKSQVAHVDTSLYRIQKIYWDGVNSDTTIVRREDFRGLAKDFLDMPDISSDKLKKDYEENTGYDDMTDKMFFSYTTTDKEHEIRKQDVFMGSLPDEKGNNPVETFVIDLVRAKGDSVVEKKMVWDVDKRFSVFRKVTSGNSEKVSRLVVTWNDDRQE